MSTVIARRPKKRKNCQVWTSPLLQLTSLREFPGPVQRQDSLELEKDRAENLRKPKQLEVTGHTIKKEENWTEKNKNKKQLSNLLQAHLDSQLSNKYACGKTTQGQVKVVRSHPQKWLDVTMPSTTKARSSAYVYCTDKKSLSVMSLLAEDTAKSCFSTEE